VDFTGHRAETERLLLRTYGLDDLAATHDLNSRDEVTRYLPYATRDLDASRRALGRYQTTQLAVDGDGLTLAGFDRDSGRLVGEFFLFLRSSEHRTGELGYVVHPDFWGRGLAVEGARHLLAIAFGPLDLHRVIGRLDARNEGSAQVLARLGMRHEARLLQNERFKGEWADEDQYAILRSEWEATTRRT
jgi:RimJ/RimL family protein N-acetyltransferase